ncbi:nucleotide exchange factor GrpE [Streptomyces sp. BP-8]|uniref:Protein GrpE n=1 Tax=Streptomyces sirii TaxID=3127701 RepID=A0ABZ2QUC7_9ACTN
MNRPPHVRGPARPRLALVGRGPQDGPAGLPLRTATGKERTATDPPAASEVAGAELRERTADLQRLKAEYDNYRKRVRRDRQAVAEIAVANVLGRLLPVLDALAEAAERGEVTGGFRRVADTLEAELAALGLQSVARPGAPFDPHVHEAVTCTRTDRVGDLTCSAVVRQGYRVGGQLLRPAQVAVAAPPDPDVPGAPGPPGGNTPCARAR